MKVTLAQSSHSQTSRLTQHTSQNMHTLKKRTVSKFSLFSCHHCFIACKNNDKSSRSHRLMVDTVKYLRLIFVQKAFFGMLSIFFVIGGNFAVENALDLLIKTGNSLKQLSPTVHGLIFERAYYQKDTVYLFVVVFFGWGAYFQEGLQLEYSGVI